MISIIIAVTIQLNRATRSEIYEAANLATASGSAMSPNPGFYAGEALLLADKNASTP